MASPGRLVLVKQAGMLGPRHPPPQAQAQGPLGKRRWDPRADTKRHNPDPTSAETDKNLSRFHLRITGGGRREEGLPGGAGV